MKKKCVAMLLAGGQGSRLLSLTRDIAKPAVHFGGKYRIIDFPLSNCTNSGIDTVGVLTQYQPLVLNTYIGIGSAWDLDRRNGGVTVLPPYADASDVKWYSGTASAITQNINYLEQYNPDHVLILSGDHIYKMNYAKMLSQHIEQGADATISVIEVPWDEASRFGIMNTDEEDNIIEFDEKPKNPKSNLASMGIYIFSYPILKAYLEADGEKEGSEHDFGKDIIPALLNDGKKLAAYRFKGYWKDVGTVKSLWDANMDMLDENSDLDLFDRSWRIYSANRNYPPQFVSTEAIIQDSLINEGCIVEGNVKHSVLFQGVHVGKGTKIIDSVIMPDAIIGENVVIDHAIVPSGLHVPNGTVVRSATDPDEIILVTAESIQ